MDGSGEGYDDAAITGVTSPVRAPLRGGAHPVCAFVAIDRPAGLLLLLMRAFAELLQAGCIDLSVGARTCSVRCYEHSPT